MRSFGLVAVPLALVACVKIAPFEFHDAATDDAASQACVAGAPGVTTFKNLNRDVVCGPSYAMRFSDLGYHFPDSFRIGDVEQIGVPDDEFDDERGIGIGVYPAGLINGETRTTPEPQTMIERTSTIELSGPIVKIGLAWGAEFACGVQPHGRSTFTFLPDGRIHRFDFIAHTTQTDATACDNSAASPNWAITSYTTFQGTTLRSFDASIPSTEDTSMPFNAREACFINPAGAPQFGIGLPIGGNRVRSTVVDTEVRTFAVVHDSFTGTTTPATAEEVITMMFVPPSPTSCGAIRSTLANYTQAQPRMYIGTPEAPGAPGDAAVTAPDGIYGGEYNIGTTGVDLVGAGDTARIAAESTMIPAGFAVWVRLESDHPRFVVTRPPATLVEGVDYFFQRTGPPGHGFVFWFTVPLTTDAITITPDDT